MPKRGSISQEWYRRPQRGIDQSCDKVQRTGDLAYEITVRSGDMSASFSGSPHYLFRRSASAQLTGNIVEDVEVS
jgi:hypothetical protein